MEKTPFSYILSIILIFFILILSGCSRDKNEGSQTKDKINIGVFIPGVAAGSPTYEMLIEGVKKAAGEKEGTAVTVFEAGFNQGEWEDKMTSLTATNRYNIIVTSNPAMPEICSRISKNYPKQKYIILDGYLKDNKNIYTFLYNKLEQSYLTGVIGALVTKANMPGVNADLKVGFIAGQEYPLMNNIIKPGFEKGLKAIDSGITLDFRIVGNWFDASKGAELASQMYNAGCDVILAIAGGAGQGVLSAAKEKQKYVLWFDDNGYSLSEGQVVGCTAVRQNKVAYNTVKKALAGELEYGSAEIGGIKEGYVYFIDNDPIYLKIVPENIRERIKEEERKIASREINLEMLY